MLQRITTPLLLAGALFCVQAVQGSELRVAEHSVTLSIDLHPKTVNQLLNAASDHWDISLGQAYQAYRAGDIWFVQDEVAGHTGFHVFYDGGCIFEYIQDNF